MAFKAADVDPCVWTRGEDGDKFIVCLNANDMLIATKEKAIIASVKADIAEKFKITCTFHPRNHDRLRYGLQDSTH
ncbi:hypothetical protein PC121_g11119 [Phytophthora cactorum]|nr:hypothetical protein PC121_g11119 [Phytophthora cactorum]KAG4055769.1 hypothetical protein PC123_g9128 [Phytophthora cactorum]